MLEHPVLEHLHALIGPVPLSALGLAVAAVLVAGFVRGFVGFGAALITVMVLSALLGPIVAVPVANLTGIPATVQLLPDAIRHADRKFVLPLGITTFAAAPFGTWVLVSLDPALMRIAISVFVLLVVLMLYQGWRLAKAPGMPILVGSGVAAGLVQGSAGVGGPAAVIVALSYPGTPVQQRANVIGCMAALNLCGLPALWLHGLLPWNVVMLSLVLFPFYSGGIWLGARYFNAQGQQYFRSAALLALAVTGVVTLVLAVRALY